VQALADLRADARAEQRVAPPALGRDPDELPVERVEQPARAQERVAVDPPAERDVAGPPRGDRRPARRPLGRRVLVEVQEERRAARVLDPVPQPERALEEPVAQAHVVLQHDVHVRVRGAQVREDGVPPAPPEPLAVVRAGAHVGPAAGGQPLGHGGRPGRGGVVVDPHVERRRRARPLALDVVEQALERARPAVRRDDHADAGQRLRGSRPRPRPDAGALAQLGEPVVGVAPRRGVDRVAHRVEHVGEPSPAARGC
jgi:hypothetical protein